MQEGAPLFLSLSLSTKGHGGAFRKIRAPSCAPFFSQYTYTYISIPFFQRFHTTGYGYLLRVFIFLSSDVFFKRCSTSQRGIPLPDRHYALELALFVLYYYIHTLSLAVSFFFLGHGLPFGEGPLRGFAMGGKKKSAPSAISALGFLDERMYAAAATAGVDTK